MSVVVVASVTPAAGGTGVDVTAELPPPREKDASGRGRAGVIGAARPLVEPNAPRLVMDDMVDVGANKLAELHEAESDPIIPVAARARRTTGVCTMKQSAHS